MDGFLHIRMLLINMFNRFQQYLLWFFALRKWETNDIKLNKQIQISESLDKNDTVP